MVNNNDKKPSRNTPKDNIPGQQFDDQVPLEDLKIEEQQERKKYKTQDDSESEEKQKGKLNNHS